MCKLTVNELLTAISSLEENGRTGEERGKEWEREEKGRREKKEKKKNTNKNNIEKRMGLDSGRGGRGWYMWGREAIEIFCIPGSRKAHYI